MTARPASTARAAWYPSPRHIGLQVRQIADTTWRRLRAPWFRQEVSVERPLDAALMSHMAVLARAIGAEPVPGNAVDVLVDGPATHEAMFDAIAGARDHVNLESYIVDDGGAGQQLAELLLRKRAEGVRINLMFDGWGSWKTSSRYFERLRAAGVELVEFNPINPFRHPIAWTLHLRNHRKLLVVDGQVAFIGGVNISRVYAPSPKQSVRRWRDTHLRITGPVVGVMQRLFLDHWQQSANRCAQPAAYFPPLSRAGALSVAVAACNAGRRRNALYRALHAAIATAQSSICITSAYFVPTRGLVRALIAAARRGVDVRLALPGFSDTWAPLAAGRSLYGRLLTAGVRIYERHDAMLHAKTAVIDGVWATVGSSNMDWRSFCHNAEANVIVVDRAFGEQMDAMFQQDILASRELTYQAWMRRSWLARCIERLARKLEFLL